MRNRKILISLIIIILISSSCSKNEEIISEHTFALDTFVDITVYKYKSKQKAELAIQESFELIKSLESILSVYDKKSDLYKLKENAGIQETIVNDITYRVLKSSEYYSELTEGLFDITAGPLIDLWAIDPPEGHVPTRDELTSVLPLIDYRMIKYSDSNQIKLQKEGMIANLGAIAKGTIADEVKVFLLENDIDSALINLGGNVLLIGTKPDGNEFRIGIQDPNDKRGNYLMVVTISDQALVSSGDYERFFEYEGKVYHHILNPLTGFPADTNIKQVTIVAPNSEMADGLSTSVLLLGLDKGIALIESIDIVDAIFITKDNKIYVTEGLNDKYEINDSSIESYSVITNKDDIK